MSLFIHHGGRLLRIDPLSSNGHPLPHGRIQEEIDWLFASTDTAEKQIEVKDPQAFVNSLADRVEWIEAAGGLIRNEKGETLLIFRRGHWDLPKGKIDLGETPLVAATREIWEETGIDRITAGDPLPPTYHCYGWDGKKIVKKTYWFAFSCTDNPSLTLQTEEDIEDARWMTPGVIKSLRNKIYPSLWPVLKSIMS